MSYEVLARKWRPRSFAEVVGQGHVVRPLTHALREQRLHHAFLFTGTRGVGKTTIARILAKCLNCEAGVTAEPCGTCEPCRAVDGNRFPDLIEVDAASRTRVDETRDLLENVPYAPTRGRFKVYLVDEVHMFSTHSFNALLKTLEEPPPHVKFLLATTDPQKLPVTILSRCLQFNLKGLPAEQIAGHLARVTEAEGVEAVPEALRLLAEAASGSVRDALSLLDQAVAYGGGRVLLADTQAMLGTVGRAPALALLERVAEGDGPGLLAALAGLAELAPDYDAVLVELARVLQRVAAAQVVPGAVDDGEPEAERLRALAAAAAAEDMQLAYEIVLRARRDLPLAPDPQAGFEMALLRMLAFRPLEPGAAPAAAGPTPAARGAEGSGHAPAAAPAGAAVAEAPPAAGDAGAGQPAPGAGLEDWAELVPALPLAGFARELAAHSVVQKMDGDRLALALDPEHGHLLNESRRRQLEEALVTHLGRPVRVGIELAAPGVETPAARQARREADRRQAAESAIANDPTVRQLQDTFGASILPDSVRPAD